MNTTAEHAEPLAEEEELERDREELRASHEELGKLIACTHLAAERRRKAMLRLKARWNWNNSRIAEDIGVESGTVWKAVRVKGSDGAGDQALAS